jgi:acyl carrier protein phosphodiesterase
LRTTRCNLLSTVATMETMAWNDEKLDALAAEVHEGFAKSDARFARLETRMETESVRTDERFKAVGERFDEVNRRIDKLDGDMREGFAELNAKFDALDAKFDALNRIMIQVGGGLIGTMILALVTVLVTHA